VNLIIVVVVTFVCLTRLPAYGQPPTTNIDRTALAVWDRYANCEETMTYSACFDLLSDAARRGWAQQRRITSVDGYESYKQRNDYANLRLTLLGANRKGAAVILRVLASGMNEGRSFLTFQEYFVVRESGGWKVDRLEVDGKVQLP